MEHAASGRVRVSRGGRQAGGGRREKRRGGAGRAEARRLRAMQISLTYLHYGVRPWILLNAERLHFRAHGEGKIIYTAQSEECVPSKRIVCVTVKSFFNYVCISFFL